MVINFRGFFLPKEETADNDGANSEPDSESDDFENPDYRDIIQIAGGKYQSFNASKTRCVAEKLQELDYQNGRFVLKGEKIIRARFDSMFSRPWWTVELFEVNSNSRTPRTEKIPSYSIRCDESVDKSLLSLFLTQGCCVNEQHASLFLEFIESRNLRPTFVDLLENLREFAGSGEINSAVAKQIRTSMASTRKLSFFTISCKQWLFTEVYPHGTIHTSTFFYLVTQSFVEILRELLHVCLLRYNLFVIRNTKGKNSSFQRPIDL